MEPQATKEGENEVKNKPTTCKKEVKKEVAQKKEKKRKRKIEESDSNEVVEVDDEKNIEVNARPLNQRITPKQFMKSFQEVDETWKEFLRRWRGLFGMTSGSLLNSNVIAENERLKHGPISKDFLLHSSFVRSNAALGQ
ncbi:putative ATP-dependent RNA helicase DDX20 [Bienertia sinuspersici]